MENNMKPLDVPQEMGADLGAAELPEVDETALKDALKKASEKAKDMLQG